MKGRSGDVIKYENPMLMFRSDSHRFACRTFFRKCACMTITNRKRKKIISEGLADLYKHAEKNDNVFTSIGATADRKPFRGLANSFVSGCHSVY